jgi:hypothetical protein
MEKVKFLIVVIVTFFSLSLATALPSSAVTKDWALKNLVNRIRGYTLPVWQIFKDGSQRGVKWKTHQDNPRFAVFDPDGDSTTDNATWSDDLVLDRETGLVWERKPNYASNWIDALDHCYGDMTKGGRKGWRLAKIEELASLVEPEETNPALPDGHPFSIFSGVSLSDYWSSTVDGDDPSRVLALDSYDGEFKSIAKSFFDGISLCVRGGRGGEGH